MPTKDSSLIYHCPCPECQAHPRGRITRVHRRINRLAASLDEKHRRQLVGLWASQFGHGGIQLMAQVTGLDRNTIARGQRELDLADPAPGRVRVPGGGRPRLEKKDRTCRGPSPR
jgi:hypothetical protein